MAGSGYLFAGRVFPDIGRLCGAMAVEWEEGKRELFSGKLRLYFQKTDRDLSYGCLGAENAYRRNPARADVIYWRWLYRSGGLKTFYWKGTEYGGIDQTAALLSSGKSAELERITGELCMRQMFSQFAENAGKDETILEAVRFLERCMARSGGTYMGRSFGLVLGLVLEEKREFAFDKCTFTDTGALAAHLQTYADKSAAALERKLGPLFPDGKNLAPEFLAWLLVLGKHRSVTFWQTRFMTFGGQEEPEEDGTDGGRTPDGTDMAAGRYGEGAGGTDAAADRFGNAACGRDSAAEISGYPADMPDIGAAADGEDGLSEGHIPIAGD